MQQPAATATAENAEAPIAATALRYMDFMELLQVAEINAYFEDTTSHSSGCYSTVTDFARFLGLSTSVPRARAA